MVKRFFELKYRNTEYESNHHKLIINTKEVDLNLSPARAVENDVWCFVDDNNCILEGCNETYTPFGCPVSYTALTSHTACEKIETTKITNNNAGKILLILLSKNFLKSILPSL
mgnify:CR=1 FL=1